MGDVIYKYGPFVVAPHTPLEFRGQPVYVATHVDGEIYLWCRNPQIGEAGREGKAKLVFTGEEYTGAYIGTVISRKGFVYHAVEIF